MNGFPKTSKGQLSLEALISFAALLSAISILIFSAQELGSRLAHSASEASERYALSYMALCLDEAASSMRYSFYQFQNRAGSRAEGQELISASYPGAGQKLLYNASSGGAIYGGTTGYEPI